MARCCCATTNIPEHCPANCSGVRWPAPKLSAERSRAQSPVLRGRSLNHIRHIIQRDVRSWYKPLRRAPLHLLPRHFLRLEGQDLLGGIAANVLQDLVRVLTETRRALPEWGRGLLKHKRAGNQFEPIVELHQVVVRGDLRVCGQVANSIHHREPEPFFSKELLPMSPRVPGKGLVEQANQFSAMLCR